MGTPPVPTGVGHVVRVVCIVAVTVAPGPPGAAVAEVLPVKEAEVELLVTGSSSSLSSPGWTVAVGSAVPVAVAVSSGTSVVVLGATEEVADAVGPEVSWSAPAVTVTGERPVAKLATVRVWTASKE